MNTLKRCARVSYMYVGACSYTKQVRAISTMLCTFVLPLLWALLKSRKKMFSLHRNSFCPWFFSPPLVLFFLSPPFPWKESFLSLHPGLGWAEPLISTPHTSYAVFDHWFLDASLNSGDRCHCLPSGFVFFYPEANSSLLG